METTKLQSVGFMEVQEPCTVGEIKEILKEAHLEVDEYHAHKTCPLGVPYVAKHGGCPSLGLYVFNDMMGHYRDSALPDDSILQKRVWISVKRAAS